MEIGHYEALYRYELNHWWYRVRRALVHDMLSAYLENRTGLQIADIGCGAGALTKELERYGKCTGIDLSEQAIAFCQSRGVRDVRLGSVEATGCADDSLDLVVCLDVLEHIPDDTKGIAEIHRILKPGGIAIIFVPTFMFLWGVTDNVSHHHRRYRLPLLAKKINGVHFTILRQSYFNTLLFPFIALIRVLVRILRIKMKSEITTAHGVINCILYFIFNIEPKLLQHVNLPFGVSGLLVLRKI